jgi:hypothetical protein
MNKLEILKQAAGLVAGLGVSKIVAGIVANNVATETNYQKVVVFAGRTAIAAVISSVVQDHINTVVDDGAAWVNSNILVK